MFRRFFRVVRGMQVMAMRDVGMVPGFFMVAGTVVLGRLPVMMGCTLVVFRSLRMMFRAGLAHRGKCRVFGLKGSSELIKLQPTIVPAREGSKLQFCYRASGQSCPARFEGGGSFGRAVTGRAGPRRKRGQGIG
jgi:hypothetical protein